MKSNVCFGATSDGRFAVSVDGEIREFHTSLGAAKREAERAAKPFVPRRMYYPMPSVEPPPAPVPSEIPPEIAPPQLIDEDVAEMAEQVKPARRRKQKRE